MALADAGGAQVTLRPRLISVRELVPEIPARTYVTHGLDKYPAKMVPHLARYAIREVSRPGDLVFDPFCGCGTVLVEARLMGRRSTGLDVNPIAVVLARAKSAVYNVEHFAQLVEQVIAAARQGVAVTRPPMPDWLEYWFSPAALRKLQSIRDSIQMQRTRAPYRDLLVACLIMAVRRCSRADPRSPKPFISRRARENRVGRHFDAHAVFADMAGRMRTAATDFIGRLDKESVAAVARVGDSRLVTRADVGAVDAVITSPPYLSAQDYYRSSKLELAVAGFWTPGIERTLGCKMIGSGRGEVLPRNCQASRKAIPVQLPLLTERSSAIVQDYLLDMGRMLRRTHGCLRVGGFCCMVIGDSTIENTCLPVHEWIARLGQNVGFELSRHEVDLIRDRRVPPKREGHRSVIDREHLLFFRKR